MDQSSEGLTIQTKYGTIEYKERSGSEKACITICEFANGSCDCQKSGKRICLTVEKAFGKILKYASED